jgi:hypothetical protein
MWSKALSFITDQNSYTHKEYCCFSSQRMTLILNHFIRVFTIPYMAIVPVDCSTYIKCFFIEKQFCWGRIHPLQFWKAFLKQTIFTNPDLCVLTYVPPEVCKHWISVSCAKHHDSWLSQPNSVQHGGPFCCKTPPVSFKCSSHCITICKSVLLDLCAPDYLHQTWMYNLNFANHQTHFTFCSTEHTFSSTEAEWGGVSNWV